VLPVTGRGALAVARVGGVSVIERASARSPLVLVPTRRCGDAAWVFASSLGGGLVDGDQLALAVDVKADAALLLTTQSSTKVYRSPRGCAQTLAAQVAPGGLLALCPDPVVCFAEARYAQEIAIELQPGGSLVLVDGLAAGRSARGERWRLARYASAITVGAGLRDAVVLDPAHGPLPERLGRFDLLATVIAMGPRAAPVAADLLAAGPPLGRRADLLIAPSPIAGGAIARLAATSVEEAALAVRGLLRGLGPLLGDDPFARVQ
jgi:urease accessory protein